MSTRKDWTLHVPPTQDRARREAVSVSEFAQVARTLAFTPISIVVLRYGRLMRSIEGDDVERTAIFPWH